MSPISVFLALLLYCRAAPTTDNEEMKKKLIYPGSSDTFENRQAVKATLASINAKTHKLLEAAGRQTPPPKPDRGPKNNVTYSLSEINKDIKEWMFEADMVLTPEQAKAIDDGKEDTPARSKRACITNPSGLWNPAIPINYTFDSSLSSEGIAAIQKGLQYYMSHTCITYTENPNGNNRLRFYAGSGCWSYIGKQPTWPSQDISLPEGCYQLGTVTHEIAHSLGFYHTQSRYDRNDYVSVDMDNINPDLQYNFAQMTRKTSTHFGLPYDYGSMMEYDAYAFAENPNQYTIWPKNSIWTNTMGQRVAPAFSDMLEVNWLYNCSSLCSNVPVPPCRQPGYQNPRDCSSCLCPQMFGGQYCGQLPTGNAVNCNGKVIQATSSTWTTMKGLAGDPSSYSELNEPTDCYWHIAAPEGQTLQLRLSTPPSNCMEGCPWQSIELNMGEFERYGMIMCCQSDVGQIYSSTGNLVGIRGAVRYNQLAFTFDYRVV